jgi:AmmeMemoRadiSam system protein B
MSLVRPKLRRGLTARESPNDPRFVLLRDPYRLSDQILQIPRWVAVWLNMLDGQSTLPQIQTRIALHFGGQTISLPELESVVRALDEADFLEDEAFLRLLEQSDRPPACIGVYPADPKQIPQQLDRLFSAPGGPGLPREPGCRIPSEGRISALLVPHMDYQRGGITYGWGFKELVERSDATLFFIVGTSHYSPARFSLTRQNYVTPLGRVETDQRVVDSLVQEFSNGLFEDELAHFPEHSIELEVLLLQYLLRDRPFRIVPLLVGSFHDCVQKKRLPRTVLEIQRLIRAIRRTAQESAERICFIISGDLAHIGPKFDDPDPVDAMILKHSRDRDQLLLDALERPSTGDYFSAIAEEQDARRICGLPPTYLVLEAIQPRWGKLLRYGRCLHPEGYESVSFASAVFGE